MVVHSPKRRRTDNGPFSADSIAQANETVQFFTGQGRGQNRWMQGYTPLRADEAIHTSPKQTTQTSRPAVNARQEQHAQLPHEAGAMDPNTSSDGRNAVTAHLVQYESPTTSTTPNRAALSVNGTSRKSLEPMARSGAQPGLPSPVSSDGNRHSPAISQHESGPRRAPGRPRVYTNTEGDASVVSGHISPVVGTHQQVPSHSHRQPSAMPTAHPPNMNSVAHGSASLQQRASHVVPSQPFTPQPHQLLQSQGSVFEQANMRLRLDAFEKKELSKLPYNNVDRGRLTLLREAVDKGDMFYIVLSQVHCLTASPALMPQSAGRLNLRSFQYLDMLLCPNQAVTPEVLAWLTDFPAHIMSTYSSSSAGPYDMYVRAVVSFLARLPLQWDALVQESKKRQAPPLMDDLYERLQLFSPVLQTTAFRAIARMVWDDGSEKLEFLHRLDQQGFSHGRKRTLQEKIVAYQAYRKTMQEWKQYEQKAKQHVIHQQRLPERQRVPILSFAISQDAIAAFQFSPQMLAPQQVLQSNSPSIMASIQQQQAMLANAQRLSHMERMSVDGRGSPAQTGAPQQPQPPSANRGVIMVPMPAQLLPPGPHLVFPHESEQPRAQPTQPDTNRSALHQAHLRSPLLGPGKPSPDGQRLYRYVSSYVMAPRKINKDMPIEKIHFDISKELFDNIPATKPSRHPGEPPTRVLDESSQTVRLRCAALNVKGSPEQNDWAEADNSWPDNLYLECNGVMLEPRRKLQHNRYLPIDLTTYLKPGDNELTVIVSRISTDTRPFEYSLAIEIVGVLSHEKIVQDLHYIKALDSLAAIKKSLSATNDDDDIAITSSNVTIKLFDPYSNSKMFDMPVRGAACLHKDCFDLETFLQIRKRDKPGWPTVVDCWRCPICRGDVRPHALVVDGFLVQVREELAGRKLLDTRAILVEPDGSWKPKEEERTGVRSPSLEREERSASVVNVGVAPAVRKMTEIIEID